MLVEDSNALFIASHSAPLLQSVCAHGLVLHSGYAGFYRSVANAIRFYKRKILKVKVKA